MKELWTMRQHLPIITTASEAVAPDLYDQIELSENLRALLDQRVKLGQERYETLLMTGNGRSALRDLLEEVADAVFYAHQLVMEKEKGYCIRDQLIEIAERLVKDF